MLAAKEDRLVGLWMMGQKYFGDTVIGEMIENDDLPLFFTVKEWLDEYFDGKRPDPDRIPLAPIGGAFRQEVWKILTEIPYGEVTTYGRIAKEVAKRMGKANMSNQAIGGAVGHNPISIIIPCHRVVGADGNLTGYSGGIEKKRMLLELEDVDLSRQMKASV